MVPRPEAHAGMPARPLAVRSGPGRLAAWRPEHLARRSALRERLWCPERLECQQPGVPLAQVSRSAPFQRGRRGAARRGGPSAPLAPSLEHPRPEAVCRGVLAVALARSLGCPRPVALSGCRRPVASWVARRDAPAAQPWFRRAMGRSATRLEPASQSAPAAALHQKAGAAQETASPSEWKAVEASAWVPPAASAQWELPPMAEAAVESDAQAPPQEVAGSESDVRVRPLEVAAEAALDAAARLPEEAVAALDVAAVQPPVAGAAVPGVAVGQPPAEVGQASDEEAALRRAAGEQVPVEWGRPPAAVRPSAAAAAPWLCLPLPWLAPRRAERSAPAMRRSQAASPSKQLWQAARCEGLS